jgi:hypothetical protein
MKKIKNIIALSAALLSLSSCSDYLDLVPENDVLSEEKIFEMRSGVMQWLSDCNQVIPYLQISETRNPALTGADEFVGSNYARSYLSFLNIADGQQNSVNPLGDYWTNSGLYYDIRRLNTFITRIDNTYNLKPGEREEFKAIAKATKANIYFQLMRMYGPFVLVPKNIDVWASLDEMRQPRATVDACFDSMLQLLDEAIPDLPWFEDQAADLHGHMYKEAAMGLKARVLLYRASPLFNGGAPQYRNFRNKEGELLFPQEENKQKWVDCATYVDAIVPELENHGYGLVQGNTNKGSNLLNTMRDLEQSWYPGGVFRPSKESIWIQIGTGQLYRYCLPMVGKSGDYDYNVLFYGCLAANKRMADRFYTANGLPMSEDKTWKYGEGNNMAQENAPSYANVVPLATDVIASNIGREPRYYATIASPGLYWNLDNSGARNQIVDNRRGEKFGLKETRIDQNAGQNITGYFVKKIIDTSIAQSWSAYPNSINEAYQGTGVQMRMAELLLIGAEAWNEAEGPDGSHRQNLFRYINAVRERAGIPSVEESYTLYGNNPTKFRTQEGMRQIIHQEITNEFMFEGHRFWDVRRWVAANDEGLNLRPTGWVVTGTSWQSFFNFGQGPVEVWNKAYFNENRDYFWPIKAEEATISGVVQNPGW